jgi:hypothetical protein
VQRLLPHDGEVAGGAVAGSTLVISGSGRWPRRSQVRGRLATPRSRQLAEGFAKFRGTDMDMALIWGRGILTHHDHYRSTSRRTAGASGFLLLSHSDDRRD